MAWSKPTTRTATRIGERAAARLMDHGVPLSDTERTLIARACALAADEVLDGPNGLRGRVQERAEVTDHHD